MNNINNTLILTKLLENLKFPRNRIFRSKNLCRKNNSKELKLNVVNFEEICTKILNNTKSIGHNNPTTFTNQIDKVSKNLNETQNNISNKTDNVKNIEKDSKIYVENKKYLDQNCLNILKMNYKNQNFDGIKWYGKRQRYDEWRKKAESAKDKQLSCFNKNQLMFYFKTPINGNGLKRLKRIQRFKVRNSQGSYTEVENPRKSDKESKITVLIVPKKTEKSNYNATIKLTQKKDISKFSANIYEEKTKTNNLLQILTNICTASITPDRLSSSSSNTPPNSCPIDPKCSSSSIIEGTSSTSSLSTKKNNNDNNKTLNNLKKYWDRIRKIERSTVKMNDLNTLITLGGSEIGEMDSYMPIMCNSQKDRNVSANQINNIMSLSDILPQSETTKLNKTNSNFNSKNFNNQTKNPNSTISDVYLDRAIVAEKLRKSQNEKISSEEQTGYNRCDDSESQRQSILRNDFSISKIGSGGTQQFSNSEYIEKSKNLSDLASATWKPQTYENQRGFRNECRAATSTTGVGPCGGGGPRKCCNKDGGGGSGTNEFFNNNCFWIRNMGYMNLLLALLAGGLLYQALSFDPEVAAKEKREQEKKEKERLKKEEAEKKKKEAADRKAKEAAEKAAKAEKAKAAAAAAEKSKSSSKSSSSSSDRC